MTRLRRPDGPRLSTLRLAFSLVYGAGRTHLLVILAATVVSSLSVAGQLLVGRELLDLLAEQNRVGFEEMAPYLVALGVLLMASSLSQALATELRIPLTELVHRRAMVEILDMATEVDLEAFEHADFHDRLQRANVAAGGQSSAVVFGLVTIVSTSMVSIGIVAVLASVAPIVVPVALVGYLPVALVNVRNNRARYDMEYQLTELQRERWYLEHLMTDRQFAKELRAYSVVPTLRAWHDHCWDVRLTRLRELVRRRLANATAASFVTTTVMIVALSMALLLAGRGSITLGDAAVVVVGLQQLSNRLRGAGVAFGSVHEGMTFLKDYGGFRAALPEIRSRRPTAPPPTPPTTLSVEGLGYRYPGGVDDALRSVDFELRSGQIMAVVGANGSGKSTLAKLLCDLLPPDRGTVRWDGVDLAGCDPDLVRAQIAPVFQDYVQYYVAVRHAIGLGDVTAMSDDDRIREAARRAGLSELIDSHPNGLDTRLGKLFSDGADVSVGQWQRFAIARALFRDAPVVILDEPSASLDPQAEANLFDLLHELCHDRIVVFVSHRFATVRSADVVLVLDQGDVVEAGTHDELMAASGLYHDLFTLQADRYGLTA